jgi:hypothetical protein
MIFHDFGRLIRLARQIATETLGGKGRSGGSDQQFARYPASGTDRNCA